MTRHTARISRAGLILIGLILLAGGGTALARSLGAFPAVLGRSTAPLLSHAQTRYPTGHVWVWPVAAAAAAVHRAAGAVVDGRPDAHPYRAPPVPRTRPHRRGHGSARGRSHRRDHRRTRKGPRHPAGQRCTARDPPQRPGCNCQSPQTTTLTPPSCAPASKPRPSPTCAPPWNLTPSPPCCASGSAAPPTGTSPDPMARIHPPSVPPSWFCGALPSTAPRFRRNLFDARWQRPAGRSTR